MPSWTQPQLDALESAIARGVTSVTYDGKKVEYRSLAEMLSIRDRMREALGLTAVSSTRYASFRRGL